MAFSLNSRFPSMHNDLGNIIAHILLVTEAGKKFLAQVNEAYYSPANC